LDNRSLDRLFDKLQDAMPDLDSDEQRLSLRIYRSLAGGRPVTVEALARKTGLPSAKVDAILIHFFASREGAEAWVKERPSHVVLSLEEGLELARGTNPRQYRDLFAGVAGHDNARARCGGVPQEGERAEA